MVVLAIQSFASSEILVLERNISDGKIKKATFLTRSDFKMEVFGH